MDLRMTVSWISAIAKQTTTVCAFIDSRVRFPKCARAVSKRARETTTWHRPVGATAGPRSMSSKWNFYSSLMMPCWGRSHRLSDTDSGIWVQTDPERLVSHCENPRVGSERTILSILKREIYFWRNFRHWLHFLHYPMQPETKIPTFPSQCRQKRVVF